MEKKRRPNPHGHPLKRPHPDRLIEGAVRIYLEITDETGIAPDIDLFASMFGVWAPKVKKGILMGLEVRKAKAARRDRIRKHKKH